LAVIRQVHLVNRRDDAADAQERSDVRVAVSLREQAFGSVNENNCKIGRGRPCGHVARVLFVTWRVCDNEFPPRGAEVAISHVNGDALLALRSEEHTSELQSLAYLVCRLLL